MERVLLSIIIYIAYYRNIGGNSIVFSFNSLKTVGSEKLLPAHLNNFVEIMSDGSVRLRILLINNDSNHSSVNMFLPLTFLNIFSKVYKYFFESILEDGFIYAKKYEKLTVNKQFTVLYDEEEFIYPPDKETIDRNEKIEPWRL